MRSPHPTPSIYSKLIASCALVPKMTDAQASLAGAMSTSEHRVREETARATSDIQEDLVKTQVSFLDLA